jgi:hypothetical protein
MHVKPMSHAALAAATRIDRRLIDRVCSGEQKTLRISQAIELLMQVGEDEHARALESTLSEWYDWQVAVAFDQVEYVDALGRFALQVRGQALLIAEELRALDDAIWTFWEIQRETFLGVTPQQRLEDVRSAFREVHARDPTPLSQRLRRQARAMFLAEAHQHRRRAKGLRRGLHLSTETISAAAVYVRTHRLRRHGLLPAKSKPIRYKPTSRPVCPS